MILRTPFLLVRHIFVNLGFYFVSEYIIIQGLYRIRTVIQVSIL